ncbi:hypothetical protein [Stakelama tenebrarum]|uniref:Uncharacterized protein n=1 Tax=Stakelama tenebrarum TaxID=2711215 RepID=A0A6G6Y146_9SPHN|nr:hypothetical protein [Sphingosinithalassobacter tenebrarum]QIG78333.1 hypothetical protein G5C33_16400 [Sphingosinithalassobacter tenebrarum]
MKGALVILVAGTILSGLAATYATTTRTLSDPAATLELTAAPVAAEAAGQIAARN